MFTQGMEISRETLSEHLTGLKSLLRLNADGIGDDEDLATQLNRSVFAFIPFTEAAVADLGPNRTRVALDRFEGDLLGHQHIIRGDVITPDTLPPSSCSSATADEDFDREDGVPYFSRPTTASSMTSTRFSLDSLPSSWKNSSNGLLSPRDSLSRKPYACVEDVEEKDEEEEEACTSEAEEETVQNDVAFQRLSMLLAGLQAQAEAAVSSPTTPLRQPGALDLSVGIEEEQQEELLFPDMSRSTSSSMMTVTNSAIGSSTPGPGTPKLTQPFQRSSTLPFIAPRPPRGGSRAIVDKDEDLTYRSTAHSPIISLSSTIPLSPILKPSTSTSPLPSTFDLPPTPPSTLRKRPTVLDVSPSKSAVLSTLSSPALYQKPGVASTLPSPALLARRGSHLKDTDFEALLNEFLEVTQMRNQEGAYDVMFRWVWVYLLGGGVVWVAVGWMLGWGCRECNSCSAVSS